MLESHNDTAVMLAEYLAGDVKAFAAMMNQKARELGLYMQKYCGCVFSEEDRYEKQIRRDREKFAEQ